MKIASVKAIPGTKTVILVDEEDISYAFDCRPYIKGDWYSQLEGDEYFSKVKVDKPFFISWPEGQDIAPDDIDYYAVPLNGTDKQAAETQKASLEELLDFVDSLPAKPWNRPDTKEADRELLSHRYDEAPHPGSGQDEHGKAAAYTYTVSYSPEDNEFVGTCEKYPGMSWLADSQEEALKGIVKAVEEILEEYPEEELPAEELDKRFDNDEDVSAFFDFDSSERINSTIDQLRTKDKIIRLNENGETVLPAEWYCPEDDDLYQEQPDPRNKEDE